ncbi:HD domain-containing protein [Pseudomonas kilonensis]|uniref:Histidine kinase-, DNA gyrase B-, and HSP90-like ATPase n=1 Tax=Pseudomonas kilonensis TaxID=132476 RepID=A0ABY0YZR0_9PSED|nr:ATP-binding protein [Pseudomonas kilonensis]SEE13986.1 Histidine kinase-, DNA gyrase B-, and HSP90-like ATPase [Pseudomonas kilonensis]
MQLPPRIENLIRQDHALNAAVLKALSIVEPWTLDNRTVFFHEYTDHSLKHLAEVLLTAEGLISDESWPHLTAEDGAVITLSVLLHDCALHISEDGFFSLIEGRYQSAPSRYIQNEMAWPALWDQFLTEARRFDQRKLHALFGSSDPIQDIPSNKLDLTFKHRLLIGEFLRRHHARLAHEIAISGIPGPNSPLSLADDEFRDLMDLSGYVARSHNSSIRSAVDVLEPNQRRVHRNCRAPFIMMVLRIADYLQIHSSRAPGQLLRLKSLVSPVSRGEWRKHMSVREINQAHDDPEAIFVDCEPESAATFLGMQSLLRDIQSELDKSWAVLGEVYGRLPPLSSLGITIRRIRSNIDDPHLFWKQRKPPFLPRDFRFKTASAELMDLLVMPLYGEKPEIGIRELVQNAVDACRERDDLIVKGLVTSTLKSSDDVIVTLNCSDGSAAKLVIEDFGVGMTSDVVDKYLLNIGASFRRSDIWRKNHESAGHSTVHRTGRFGIGLLAAFLLGPEIKVTTRSIFDTEDDAITFSCKQGSESIEVRPCKFHAGTRIEIPISDKVKAKLIKEAGLWDWYCLASPSVKRIFADETETHLRQKYTVPECDSNLDSTKWRRVFAEGYDDILWSYEMLEKWGRPDDIVICNGVMVCQNSRKLTPAISEELGYISATPPSLVVFDADGRFPINLQRDAVVMDHTEFQKELALDLSNYLATRLIHKFENLNPGITPENVLLTVKPGIIGMSPTGDYRNKISPIVISKTGIIPTDADLLRAAKITSIVIDPANVSNSRGAFTSQSLTEWAEHYVAVDGITHTKISRTNFLRDSIGGYEQYGTSTVFFEPLGVVGRRILVRKKDVSELVTPGNVPRSQWNRLTLEVDLGAWGLWAMGIVPPLTLDLSAVCAELTLTDSFGITLLYFGSDTNIREAADSQPSAFSEVWDQLVRAPVLQQRSRY